MLPQLSHPIIFAHRGASAHAPENTLASFRLAADLGAPAIELDVKLTADKEVVVLHDPSVDRTTNGKGLLSQLTLAELRELDAGSSFSPAFKGERIPTLAEVFDEVGMRLYINVELTNYSTSTDDLVPRVVELVRKHGMQKKVIFSSFLPQNLSKARKLIPEVSLGQLAMQGIQGWPFRSAIGNIFPHEALHPYFTDVNAALVERMHRQKRSINVWTVDDPVEMRRLIALGVDGIITDDPALALQVAAERLNGSPTLNE
jgi:glycerophosphoryl diester phosphodiesterase